MMPGALGMEKGRKPIKDAFLAGFRCGHLGLSPAGKLQEIM